MEPKHAETQRASYSDAILDQLLAGADRPRPIAGGRRSEADVRSHGCDVTVTSSAANDTANRARRRVDGQPMTPSRRAGNSLR